MSLSPASESAPRRKALLRDGEEWMFRRGERGREEEGGVAARSSEDSASTDNASTGTLSSCALAF